ncbi:MAG: catecholate siderophore receptor Fiu [Dokdonella sp.]
MGYQSASRTASTLLTSLALGICVPAQTRAAAVLSPDASDATTLDKVEVKGERIEQISSKKFTQSLQDTPQTIQVISSALFNQQGATTLTEALRNSAGVGTFYAGENGNTTTGDAVYLRGFDTSGSLFVDGVRDVGSVSRDTFNIDQIEVFKGPAGTDNGRSAPTGSINLVSKQAQLGDRTAGSIMAGVDGQKRTTADWNQTLGETSAFRLNAMWQDSDVAGRDHVNNSRWGLAPSLAFGLGTPTRVVLNLLYVKQDNVPDGYVPTIGLPGWQPQPGLEQLVGNAVDPQKFYGTRDDHDNSTARMATLQFEHDFSDSVTLSNAARWGDTKQDYLLSAFMTTGGTAANPMAGNIRWTDINGLSTYSLIRSNNTFKDQGNKILTDQLNLRVDFATGSVEHSLSTGLEFTREEQDIYSIASTGNRPAANLYNPDWNATGDFAWSRSGAGSFGRTDTGSLYLFDTLKFGERFLLTAGVRADHYSTEYQSSAICTTTTPLPRGGVACPSGTSGGSLISTADLEKSDTLVNWKLGAVFKPIDSLSLYANYALSQQPPGGANFQLSSIEGNVNGVNADPQKAKTFELGAKWSVLDERLALNAAVFRTDVTNEINTQVLDDNGNPTQTGEKRVDGIELSAVGNLTNAWSISAGYSHLNTEVVEGPAVTSDGTPNLTYTPGDSFTAWTTYRLPFGLEIGGGARYIEGLHRGTDGAVGTPTNTESYTVLDALASYQFNDNTLLRLNAYNLADRQYVAAINKSGYRYQPGLTRTFTLSVDFTF